MSTVLDLVVPFTLKAVNSGKDNDKDDNVNNNDDGASSSIGWSSS